MLKEEEICSKHETRKTTAEICSNVRGGITIIKARAHQKERKYIVGRRKIKEGKFGSYSLRTNLNKSLARNDPD